MKLLKNWEHMSPPKDYNSSTMTEFKNMEIIKIKD